MGERNREAESAQRSLETPAEFFARVIPHTPWPKQQEFLDNICRELLWGGGGGGGKSDGVLMLFGKYGHIAGFSMLVLRRTYQQMMKADAILARAIEWWFGKPGIRYDRENHTFEFECPGGGISKCAFGHLENSLSHYNYQGMRAHIVVFEEVTQHIARHYRYLFSRQRKNVDVPTSVVPLMTRSTGNPDGPEREWVYTRFINPETRDSKTTWMTSRVEDNPSVDLPSYEESLSRLDPITYKRLRFGEGWEAAEPGDFFDRENFVIVRDAQAIPALDMVVRFYDFAASKKKHSKFTASVKMGYTSRDGGFWYVLDAMEEKWGAAEQPQLLALQAQEDGHAVVIRWEMEGGSSGSVATEAAYKPALPGFDADGVRPLGGKEDRAKPLAGQVRARRVYVLERPWTKHFLDRLHAFPNDAYKDMVDAASGAFNWLAEHGIGVPKITRVNEGTSTGLRTSGKGPFG